MKQKINIEIDSSEFQKAFESQVDAHVKSSLRTNIDKGIAKYAKDYLEKRVTPESVNRIMERHVSSTLSGPGWNSFNLRDEAKQLINEKKLK